MSKPNPSHADESELVKYYLPIPAGTPYSLLAQAVNKFGVEIVERDIILPGSAQDEIVPKSWVLRGDKKDLEKAKKFIAEKIKEHLKKFE
jgi:hypothetical protein